MTARVVHTGQHYDHDMSQTFFDDLEIPPPPCTWRRARAATPCRPPAHGRLRRSSASAESRMSVMVVGDVNSTLACSLVAKKLGVEVAHLEAGFAELRPRHARRDQPYGDRCNIGLFFVTEESGSKTLCGRGSRRKNSFRRPCHDRQPPVPERQARTAAGSM